LSKTKNQRAKSKDQRPKTKDLSPVHMTQKLQVDKWLFSATVGLALFGVVMVYSASAMIAVQENHSQFHYVVKQGIWTLIGFGAMFVMMRFDYQKLNRAWIVYGLLLLTILLLLAVFAFPPVNGARRWIKLSGFSAQPSEVAKLSLAIFVAYVIERRAGDEGSFWKTFVPCMFALTIFGQIGDGPRPIVRGRCRARCGGSSMQPHRACDAPHAPVIHPRTPPTSGDTAWTLHRPPRPPP